MSFLQPFLLWGLPLALLPVIIHLIHLHRRKTVPWAATIFLLAAQQMNRGYSRLRRFLILAFRVLALAALFAMVARPLAGGLLGLTGGAPDTVLVLLDRSASMEQQNLASGTSKREAGLTKLVGALKEAYRGRSRLVLIDSATREALPVERPEALADLPATWATDTTGDMPGLLQSALDHITTNQTGRTDVWVLSDLQQADWDASGGRWESLRSGFSALPGVRFHLLSYPTPATGNLAITVDRVERRSTVDKAELLLDLEVTHPGINATGDGAETELPIRFVVNGTTSVHKATLRDNRLSLRGHAIPIDRETERGWGRVELPADTHPGDNTFHFVFDKQPVLRSTILSDDPFSMAPIKAALSAPADPSRNYQADILPTDRLSELEWDATALIIWNAPLPAPDSLESRQLLDHVAAGRSLLFLPPDITGDGSFLGVSWEDWIETGAAEPDRISWWRSDSGPMANTRSGKALPVGEIEISRRRTLVSDGANSLPLARIESDGAAVLLAALPDSAASASAGDVLFLATPPGTGGSTLARDGVVLYAFLQRLLDQGAGSLGTALQREAALGSLGVDAAKWTAPESPREDPTELVSTDLRPLRAGILQTDGQLLALNRPAEEDQPRYLDTSALGELFTGLDHRIIEDTVEDETSLASEIWRTFLLLMAVALVLEALLSMPPKKDTRTVEEAALGFKGGKA